jgi:hypothetical protein
MILALLPPLVLQALLPAASASGRGKPGPMCEASHWQTGHAFVHDPEAGEPPYANGTAATPAECCAACSKDEQCLAWCAAPSPARPPARRPPVGVSSAESAPGASLPPYRPDLRAG